ncbi:tRNA guanosine(15) transglycosylase TgtA [Candidatus Borrarchaeum sp.]|uniref:tRNA guanosine(15) transglycosylase TgtA n=1 Tax=Candidatus Borrarchaeum sp. TaxID=2846742 RepID=UPI00257A94DA|nr:tRNA guanosine(15) transglycosylase TgtA [Candidatus Borrarchaeum sp.]
MSFEVIEHDVGGRIGKLYTRHGVVNTPALIPVLIPTKKPISPKILETEFNCEIIITSAYLLKQYIARSSENLSDLHSFFHFNGPIMTDSGAFQILHYGGVSITPEEVIDFQEKIHSDIAVILDLPIGPDLTYEQAKYNVAQTLQRAKESLNLRNVEDILWVGPIQGGAYSELIEHCAKTMYDLSFDMYALGSVTPFMEQYNFTKLVEGIATAKMNLPIQRPFHLFGAGHPLFFSLLIALGCDTFDSAAYALFAKENRYMTPSGTYLLDSLEVFPCSCPVCIKYTPSELKATNAELRYELLASHNLYISLQEIRTIRQAILDGRLWELLEARARMHPRFLQAFSHLKKYRDWLEKFDPISKRRALFFYGKEGLSRPNLVRHQEHVTTYYHPPSDAPILTILPETNIKPFRSSPGHIRLIESLKEVFSEYFPYLHLVTFVIPFGCVPSEVENIYPLSQYETSRIIDRASLKFAWESFEEYLNIHKSNYRIIILFNNASQWNSFITQKMTSLCQQLGYLLFIIPEELYAGTLTKKLHQLLKEIVQVSVSHLER